MANVTPERDTLRALADDLAKLREEMVKNFSGSQHEAAAITAVAKAEEAARAGRASTKFFHASR